MHCMTTPCTYLGHVTRPAEGENRPSEMGQRRGAQDGLSHIIQVGYGGVYIGEITVSYVWAQTIL